MTLSQRTARSLAAAGALALAAAGCGSSSSTSSSATPTTASSPGTAAPAAGTTDRGGADASHSETATLTEFHIALSSGSLQAGSTTLTVRNAGTTLHALDITGPSGAVAQSGPVLPGHTTTMTVNLAAGSYQVYCPVGNHRDLGMATTLTVSGGAAASSQGSPAPTASFGYSAGY